MPTLPTQDSLPTLTPQSNRAIASNPQAGAPGQALEGLGENVSRIGSGMLEKQDKLAFAAQKSAVLAKDVELRQQLQDDPDYATWATRYTAGMAPVIAQAAQALPNHSDRSLFTADTKLDVARGNAELSQAAHGRFVSAQVGLLDQTTLTNHAAALNAPDDATRNAIYKAQDQAIQGAVDHGYISAPDGVQRRHTFVETHVIQQIGALNDKGDLAGADALLKSSISAGMLDVDVAARLSHQLHDATENRANIDYVDHVLTAGKAAGDPYAEFPIVPPTDRAQWDKRADGSDKGTGFLGLRKRPDGAVSSEISVGLEVNGKEREIPTMVPGLTPEEMHWLLTTPVKEVAGDIADSLHGHRHDIPASIARKAVANAQARIAGGLSPFKQDGEPDYVPPSSAAAAASGQPSGKLDPVTFFKEFVLPHEGGYAAHDANGAPVNFGINQSANPGVDVSKLTKDQAAQIFANKYFAASGSADLPPALAAVNADTAYINPARAKEFLAKSDGDPQKYMALRQAWMDGLVKSDPGKYGKYEKAWNTRNHDLAAYAGQAGGAVPAGEPHDLTSVYAQIDADSQQQGWTPERRQAVKDMAAARISRETAAQNQQQNATFEAALTKADALGDQFTNVSQLGDAFYKASPTDQHRLRSMAEANLKASLAGPAPNGDVIRAIHVMAIEKPDQFAAANLAQYKPFVSAAEFDQISQDQARARMQTPNAWNPRAGITAAIEWGKNFGGVKVPDGEDKYRVYRFMEARAREQAAQNGGKPPTESDYQRFFKEATSEIKTTSSFISPSIMSRTTTKRGYEVPNAHYKGVIERQFRAQFGRDPTPAETQAWFDKMGEALQ